jgi:hypothetical membrane protein
MNRPVETLNLNTTPAAPATPKTARRLALGAIAGPVLFTLAWLVLGFLSPGYTLWGTLIAPYSPIHQPISGLGMGPTAPFMNTAFVLSGLLLMAGVIGITQTTQANRRPAARWTVTALLALAPLGMVIDGIFNLQAILPHTLGFLMAAASEILSFLAAGLYFRRIPRWRRLGNRLLLASPLTLVLVVLFFSTFVPTAAGAQHGVAGLTQRLVVIGVLGWFVAMGRLAFRRS